MNSKITYFILLICAYYAMPAMTQVVTEKGISTVALTGRSCSDGKPADKKLQFQAIENAKLSAWNNYTAKLSGERSSAYLKQESAFLQSIDNYITDYTILTSNCSKQDRSYTVSLRVNINEAKLNNELVVQSGNSSAKQNLKGQGVVVLVVPRKTTEALSFDDKVTSQSQVKNSLSADEMVSDSGDAVSITESSTQRQSITTGGSTSKKATKRTYSIGDMGDASVQINNVLSPLGMRTFAAARLESMSSSSGYDPFLNDVLDQFSGKSGDLGANISPQSQNAIVDMIADVGQGRLNYFMLGTVDSSLPRIDPDTGAYKADVLVNIQLFKIDDFFGAEVVAAVGPEIKTAFGETDVLAEKAALKKAFSEATNTLILKL